MQVSAWLERVNAFFYVFFLFLFNKKVKKYEVCYSLNWFKPPMKVIDRTMAVTQHFLEKLFKKL